MLFNFLKGAGFLINGINSQPVIDLPGDEDKLSGAVDAKRSWNRFARRTIDKGQFSAYGINTEPRDAPPWKADLKKSCLVQFLDDCGRVSKRFSPDPHTAQGE